MALYFDTKLHLDHSVSVVSDIQWHNVAPVLAVAYFSEQSGGFVNVFNEEVSRPSMVSFQMFLLFCSYLQGEMEKAFLQKPVAVTALHWHPLRKYVAVGWEKGEVCVWNPQEVLSEVGSSHHKHEITGVCWTSSGTRLLTADRVCLFS